MAAPTATTYTRNVGHGIITTFHAVWANTDNHTATAIIDLSAMAYTTNLKLLQLWIEATAGISAELHFDNDDETDVSLLRHPVGSVGNLHWDFRDSPDGGLVFNPGTEGTAATKDLELLTTSAASGDEVMIVVQARCD